jgi:prepilin-type N-terminal cleavage/methylation domain-containing protein
MKRTSLWSRHGFSMIEMLVVIVVLGIIGGALTRSMLTMQRGTERQTQQADMQSDLRASAGLIPAELREVAAGIDILAATPDSVAYRAMRNTAFVCSVPAANQVTLLDATTYGYRDINTNDWIFVYGEGDPAETADDQWNAYDITAVSATTCGGAAATLLTLNPNLVVMPVPGAPVRTFETMTLKLYTSDGRGWLGARSMSAGEPIQPVLGPLDAGTGLQFVYRDAAGADLGAAPVLADIRGIDVVVLGETDYAVSTGYDSRSIRQDSVSVRVRLRNGY